MRGSSSATTVEQQEPRQQPVHDDGADDEQVVALHPAQQAEPLPRIERANRTIGRNLHGDDGGQQHDGGDADHRADDSAEPVAARPRTLRRTRRPRSSRMNDFCCSSGWIISTDSTGSSGCCHVMCSTVTSPYFRNHVSMISAERNAGPADIRRHGQQQAVEQNENDRGQVGRIGEITKQSIPDFSTRVHSLAGSPRAQFTSELHAHAQVVAAPDRVEERRALVCTVPVKMRFGASGGSASNRFVTLAYTS